MVRKPVWARLVGRVFRAPVFMLYVRLVVSSVACPQLGAKQGHEVDL
jgi:hypothetical protein